MPDQRKSLKVVLCAALTADGKLDAAAACVPPVLYERMADPERHPWGALYDQAAGVLVDGAMAGELPMPQAAGRMVVAVHLERSADATEVRAELERISFGSALQPEGLTQWQDALMATLDRLRREGVTGDLLCFGGAELFRALLDAGLADELRLIVRPHLDGRRGAATLSGVGGDFFPASVACRLLGMETLGDECLLHYRIVRRAGKRNRN